MVGCPGAMTSSARKYLRFLSERKQAVRLTFDVVSSRIWSRSYQWLDKIERKLWKSAVVLLWLWRRKAPRVLLVGYNNKTVSASERLFPATIYGH